MYPTTIFQLIVVAATALASLSSVSAGAGNINAKYKQCDSDHRQYPVDAHGKYSMTPSGLTQDKQIGTGFSFKRQEWKHGFASVKTFYYADHVPHLQVILESQGVPPAYYLLLSNQMGYLYTLPVGEKFCQIDFDIDVQVLRADVSTKGTEPTWP